MRATKLVSARSFRNELLRATRLQSGVVAATLQTNKSHSASLHTTTRYSRPIKSFRSRQLSRQFSTGSPVPFIDCVVVGGGPVGASASWFLAENEANEGKSIVMIHDPANKGAHEDWSRLARLSFDGPRQEMDLSRHAISLLDMADEVRSYQSGEPVVPVRPGMLFVASPGTNLARACTYGLENFGDEEFKQHHVDELEGLYPGNPVNLPKDTLCFSHPIGYCVSPLELAAVGRGVAKGYGVDIKAGSATIDMAPPEAGANVIRVTMDNGEQFDTRRCFLFAGAQGKKIVADAVKRSPANSVLDIPEFKDTYITAISTVRYKHRNHPADPVPDSGHVVTPITLGQLDIPELCPFQANFSIVAEEYGDVLKTRLSGSAGSETIETVEEMHNNPNREEQDKEMGQVYGNFFGHLFPYLETEKALDFNRCVTYRSHNTNFSGTSLLEKTIGEGENKATIMTTPGCFGVGVKFGPALGQAAAAHVFEQPLEAGMNMFESGNCEPDKSEDGERIERAW